MPIQETRVRFGPVIGRRLGKGRAPSGHHGIGPGQRLDPSGAVEGRRDPAVDRSGEARVRVQTEWTYFDSNYSGPAGSQT